MEISEKRELEGTLVDACLAHAPCPTPAKAGFPSGTHWARERGPPRPAVGAWLVGALTAAAAGRGLATLHCL